MATQEQDLRDLKDYCIWPTSFCERANWNCGQCPRKEEAEERRQQGRKTIDEIQPPTTRKLNL